MVKHEVVGREITQSGVIVFCRCGAAFYVRHEDARAPMIEADQRWKQHAGI
jgi:hypothetical protein